MAVRMSRKSPAELAKARSFGLTVGAVCGALSAAACWQGHPARAGWLAALAAALMVPALVKPALLRLPSAWWWRMAGWLGWLNARVLLSAFFLVIITPVGLALRLGGWDPMRRRRRAAGGWLPYPDRIGDPKHFERMF